MNDDTSPTRVDSNVRPSGMSLPGQLLLRESLSLGCILLASLLVVTAERAALIPGGGYVSSAVLLVLSMWHLRYFRVAVPIAPRPVSHVSAWAYCGALLLILALFPLAVPSSSNVSQLGFGRAIHMLLLVPCAEELFFRGLLVDHLRRGFGTVQAVVFSSLLFALLHQTHVSMIVAGCLALLACLAMLKGRSLVSAIQLHVLWNGIALASELYTKRWQSSTCIVAMAIILVFTLTRYVSWRGAVADDKAQ